MDCSSGFWGLESGAFLGFFLFVRESAFAGFVLVVFDLSVFAWFDFLGFTIFGALSRCAVRGLYGCGFN